MNYLVIVAHPDDEVLGAGASIYRWVERGHRVGVVTMVNQASARTMRSDSLVIEQNEVMRMLGVEKQYFADFPNIEMNIIPHLKLVQFLEGCIEDFRAEAIITHHPADTNIDHMETSRAAQAACRLFQRREGLPELKEFMYMEVLSSTEWSLDSSVHPFRANTYMEIGLEGVEKKMETLRVYKDVMRPYPHPRSEEAIKGLAAYRGSQAGCCYAEAFESVYRRG